MFKPITRKFKKTFYDRTMLIRLQTMNLYKRKTINSNKFS